MKKAQAWTVARPDMEIHARILPSMRIYIEVPSRIPPRKSNLPTNNRRGWEEVDPKLDVRVGLVRRPSYLTNTK